jgi:para-aminobenzoate synthetase component 1
MQWIDRMNFWGSRKIPFLFILDFELQKPEVLPLNNLPDGLYYKVQDRKNYALHSYDQCPDIIFEKFPTEYQKFQKAFEEVMAEINYGNSFLLNLTFPTPITTNLSLQAIFKLARAKYKLLYYDQFVVFSPEIFVRIEDGYISSYPMKGTIDASVPDAENIILNDEKELAEHYTIVDLIRNDLSMVADHVQVPRFRYTDLIHTHHKSLYQVSSEVKGQLPADYPSKIGNIMASLLPAGSISGAPKDKTVQIIQRIEGLERGYYTGVFGIFDGVNLDSGVMIRFIEKTEAGLRYRSGCGITSMSDCLKEYNEMIDKIYVPIDRKHQGLQQESISHQVAQ